MSADKDTDSSLSSSFDDRMAPSDDTDRARRTGPLPAAAAKPWPEDRPDVDSATSTMARCAPRPFLRRQRDALFYSYMSPLLRRGARLHKQRKNAAAVAASGHTSESTSCAPSPPSNPNLDAAPEFDAGELDELGREDVYAVPSFMRARRLAEVFWRVQKEQRAAQASAAPNTRRGCCQGKASRGTTLPFLKIMWALSKRTYLPAAAWQLIVVLCQCSLPLLVREVLLRLEENPGENFRREGLPLALLVFIVSLTEGIGSERHKFLSFQTGITLRAAVVSAAHGHVLKMTPTGRAGLTSGEITNLVAVDAQKLFELTQEGHYSWSCPLAMVIVSVLLVLELGASAFVGIVTMFLIVPFVQWVVKKMMSIRRKRVEAADKRVESTSAMLQGIRFTKLNRYEEKFIDRVMGMREMEVKLLRRELFYLALTIFATVVSPVIASAVTFVTYALLSEENILTPSMTFTSLFLFAALRFPINYAGKFMGKAAQGFQACHRFSLFFARDSLEDWREGNGENEADVGVGTTVATVKASTADTALESAESGEGSTLRLPISTVEDGDAKGAAVRDELDDFVPPPGHNENVAAVEMDAEDTAGDASRPLIDVNASFGVGAPGSISTFTLSRIEMTVRRSEIMCVVGPVASGKSTLVQGLIGEMIPLPLPDTKFKVEGKIAYASQVPFILNATVRDNILFGVPYNKERYERVLEACCLTSDIETFHFGDLTEIGERGVTLSGGQKQRLSLARVAYSAPDVAILDDPLSALDAGTGKKVFEKLFKPSGGNGLFRNTAVVLVTHASHFLNRVDSLMVLVNGRSVFVGTWGELADCHPTIPNEADAVEAIRTSVQEDHSDDSTNKQASPISSASLRRPRMSRLSSTNRSMMVGGGPSSDPSKNDNKGESFEDGKIMSVEERKYGLSQASTWLAWFHYAGGPLFLAIIVLALAFDRFMYVATEWWLAVWTQGAYEPVYSLGKEYDAQISGMEAQHAYIQTYMIVLLVSCFTTILRINWIVQGGARCASRLFVMMLKRVLYAPMSYFDTTPIGRIMNRFTYDTETLDLTLVMNMTMLMTSLGWIFTGIILQTIILPWMLLVILFIVFFYWVLVLHYRKSAVDLQRLDATSRSPVQAQLSEAIDGTATMRVFGKAAYFSHVFRDALDENSGMMMNFMAAHRWLAVRIQMLGACSVLFSVAFVASFNDVLDLDPGIAAILIIWSANFTISLSFFVQGISESEASMTSLERVMAMTEIAQEEDKSCHPEPVDETWPDNGDLTFDDVNLRYRPGLPLSLEGLSFSLQSGQRCGVVGRTGAGKSTLAAALFRLVELEGGKIVFDGVDISKISLADVRGRQNGMTIIPQEPVLLPGTLKQCLDPFGDFSDEEVAKALHSVRGASRGLGNIDEVVEEGGRNFSVGERQLICLGRALLAKPRLLFLDEATASVDGETDALIQRMLRSRFEGTTLLTIAHRLNVHHHGLCTFDVILVVDKGRAAEFGTPAELLSNEDSIFSQLVESTGKESSVALRSMVLDS
ncbi:hypothetical protein ACHAXT_002125 [Thalassiosira profunda]